MVSVTWKVDDGFMQRSSHTLHIPDNEFNECDDEEERRYVIEDAVQNDFENTVSWRIVSIDEC